MDKNPLKDKLNDDDLDLSLCSYSGKDVPVKDIAGLKRATCLDLSNNRLTGLPASFATLSHLVRIDLSCNQITALPSNFGELRRLRHLDLYNNQLVHLPLSFEHLSSLRWLDLKKNPLSDQLTKAAGTCLNQRECEQCARQVVLFMARVRVRYDEEVALRQQREREERDAELAREQAEQEQVRHEKKAKKEQKRQELLQRKKAEAAAKLLAERSDQDITDSSQSDDAKSKGDVGSPGRGRSWLERANLLLFLLVLLLGGATLFLHWDRSQAAPASGAELWLQLGAAGRRMSESGARAGALILAGAGDLLSTSGRTGARLGDWVVRGCMGAGDVAGAAWLRLQQSGAAQLLGDHVRLVTAAFCHVPQLARAQWQLWTELGAGERVWQGVSEGSARLGDALSDGGAYIAASVSDAITQLGSLAGDSVDKLKKSGKN